MNYDDVKSTIKMRLFNSFTAPRSLLLKRVKRDRMSRSTKFVLSERKDTTGVKTDEFSIKNTSSEAYLSREEEDDADDDECTSLSVYSSHYVCYPTVYLYRSGAKFRSY